MRHPLLPATALVALVILVCEGFFGLFSKLCDPARSESHYSHYVCDENWMLVSVDQLPEVSENSVKVLCDVLEITDSVDDYHSCNGKILLYFEKPADISYGDKILILSSPDLPSAADNPHQFDYRQHLRRKGILYTDYVPSDFYCIVGHNDKGFKCHIALLRQRLIETIHFSSLNPSQQGIAEALFLGWDNDLDPQTEEKFRRAGITHLLCVSGLHVGIVAAIAGFLLSFLSNKRRNRIIKGAFQIAVIWFFVILTGAAPGTTRAGLMFSFIVVGRMFFSRPSSLNAVAASALVILIVKPLIMFDVGFQLSYSAVIGIILMYRPLVNLIPIPDGNRSVTRYLLKLLSALRDLFAVSMVAQLSTMPFILYYFHQFPVYFLVANMTVVPFAGLLLGSVLVMLAFSWWPWAFGVMGHILAGELTVTEWITTAISKLPHSMLQDIWFDGLLFILAIALVATIAWLLIKPNKIAPVILLATGIIMAVYTRTVNSHYDNQSHLDFYNLGNRTAVECFAGHVSYLICDTLTAMNPKSIDYQTAGNRLWRQTRTTYVIPLDSSYEDSHLMLNNRFAEFNGVTLRIVDRSNYREISSARPKVDYLILRESPYITIDELRQRYTFDTVVIMSQNSKRRSSAWAAQCDSLNVDYINGRGQ